MELTVNGTPPQDSPDSAAIARAIHSLTGDGDSFAILAAGEMTYIQTAGGPGTGFDLEYQDGSLNAHYYCTSAPLEAAQVIDAFQRYAAGDDSWQKGLSWKREDIAAPAPPIPLKVAIVTGGLALLAVAWWFGHAG